MADSGRGGPDVTAGIPGFEDEHASLLNNVVRRMRWEECGGISGALGATWVRRNVQQVFYRRPTAAGGNREGWSGGRFRAVDVGPMGADERLMAVIGKRMEPNRLSIRLFGDVRSTTPK